MSIVNPEQYTKLDLASQNDILALLFERCPTLTELVRPVTEAAVASNANATWRDLIEAVRSCLRNLLATNADDPRIAKIIAAHPRLGAQKVDSHASQEEQRSLSSVAERIREINEEYERAFPGLRYVVFVNGRPRNEIIEEMQGRIARNNCLLEKRDAFEAMCDIALDRASKAGVLL